MKTQIGTIKDLVALRSLVIKEYTLLRDYKQNPNALMKEITHAKAMHAIVVKIDEILKDQVEFK